VVPVSPLERLAATGRAARLDEPDAGPIETTVVRDGEHSWLYEDAGYRRTVAAFLARSLGGPYEPDEAGELAARTEARRLSDAETRFAGTVVTPGGFRTLASVALPGATRRLPEPEPGSGPNETTSEVAS